MPMTADQKCQLCRDLRTHLESRNLGKPSDKKKYAFGEELIVQGFLKKPRDQKRFSSSSSSRCPLLSYMAKHMNKHFSRKTLKNERLELQLWREMGFPVVKYAERVGLACVEQVFKREANLSKRKKPCSSGGSAAFFPRAGVVGQAFSGEALASGGLK